MGRDSERVCTCGVCVGRQDVACSKLRQVHLWELCISHAHAHSHSKPRPPSLQRVKWQSRLSSRRLFPEARPLQTSWLTLCLTPSTRLLRKKCSQNHTPGFLGSAPGTQRAFFH